jgi:hypothetical protein
VSSRTALPLVVGVLWLPSVEARKAEIVCRICQRITSQQCAHRWSVRTISGAPKVAAPSLVEGSWEARYSHGLLSPLRSSRFSASVSPLVSKLRVEFGDEPSTAALDTATRLRSSEALLLAFELGLVKTPLQGLEVVMEGSVAQARSNLGRRLLLLRFSLPAGPRDESRRWWWWWAMAGAGEAIAMLCACVSVFACV